jgi:glucosamine--fructose-6-phosphate aminotransferase (isomerizing)
MNDSISTITSSATYQTIINQPTEMRRLVHDERAWESASTAAVLLARARRIFLIGTGTSYHAAQIGQFLLRVAGADAWAVPAFDFALYPQPLTAADVAIILSHRGTKLFSRQSLEKARLAGASLIAITGQGSPLSTESGVLALTTTAQERSSTHTASYTTTLAILIQIASRLAEICDRPEVALHLRTALAEAPDILATAIARQSTIADAAREIAAGTRLFLTGPGPCGVTAMEGALKCKEAAYINAEGAPLETFLHGPIVSLGPGDHLIIVNALRTGIAADRAADVARAAGQIGVKIWLVGQTPRALGSTPWIDLGAPASDEICANLPLVVPLQLLACFLASVRGTNPDTFRRDVATYDAALRAITL